MGQNTLGIVGGLKGTLKNGDCQGNHLVIYIKFLDELRGTGGHYNKIKPKHHSFIWCPYRVMSIC